MKKVTVVGAGNVGTALALYNAEKKFADVCLLDIKEGLAQGRALDAIEAASIRHLHAYLNRIFKPVKKG